MQHRGAEEKMSKTLKILLIILIVLILGLLGYFIYSNSQSSKKANQKTANPVSTSVSKTTSLSTSTSATSAATSSTSAASDWRQCVEIGAEEAETMADWLTYTNDTYNYRFQYPQTWLVETESPELVTVRGEDSGEEITFQVRNNRMTEIGFVEYNLVFTRDFTVNCENTTENTYDGADNLTLSTYRFDKSDTPYLLMFSYNDIGASYSGDIYNIDKMILKTFSFRE